MNWSERLRKTRRKFVKRNGRRLLQALDAHSRLEAIAIARRDGLLT